MCKSSERGDVVRDQPQHGKYARKHLAYCSDCSLRSGCGWPAKQLHSVQNNPHGQNYYARPLDLAALLGKIDCVVCRLKALPGKN